MALGQRFALVGSSDGLAAFLFGGNPRIKKRRIEREGTSRSMRQDNDKTANQDKTEATPKG
jgi:hypothetical protein